MNEKVNQLKSSQRFCFYGPLEVSAKHYTPKQGFFHILIDGGQKHAKNWPSNTPSLSIGDNDSSQSKLDISVSPTKDQSDLRLGLDLLPESVSEIFFYGFVGERLDHQLAVLGEISHYYQTKDSINKLEVFGIKEKIILSRGTFSFSHTGRFSLLSLQDNKVVVTGNCQYQLKEKTTLPALSSLGLSNQGHGEIEINSERPILLILELSP